MKRTTYGMAGIVLVALSIGLWGVACQTAGGGGGGGGGDNQNADVAAGQNLYNGRCTGCHGTPGAGNGDAPDVQGTGAAALQTELTGGDHGGGQIELADNEYEQLAAYLNPAAAGGDGDGDDEDGGGGGGNVATACNFATEEEIQTLRNSVQTDYANDISAEDELYLMGLGCQMNTSVDYDDCLACGQAVIDEVYP